MKAFLAAPTRGVPAPEGSVDAVRATLLSLGHEILNMPQAPTKVTVQQQETRGFMAETDRMMEADLLVAEASTPSHGVGWTVAWFLAKGRLVVLCCHASHRQDLAMLLGGNPSPWQKLVVYESLDDLKAKLTALLKR